MVTDIKAKKDNSMDRFMLDASSIVILKKGDGKKCDPKTDKSCKL